jgi:hypothetical protein
MLDDLLITRRQLIKSVGAGFVVAATPKLVIAQGLSMPLEGSYDLRIVSTIRNTLRVYVHGDDMQRSEQAMVSELYRGDAQHPMCRMHTYIDTNRPLQDLAVPIWVLASDAAPWLSRESVEYAVAHMQLSRF